MSDVAASIIRESAKAVNPGVLAAIIKWQLDLGNEEYSRPIIENNAISTLHAWHLDSPGQAALVLIVGPGQQLWPTRGRYVDEFLDYIAAYVNPTELSAPPRFFDLLTRQIQKIQIWSD